MIEVLTLGIHLDTAEPRVLLHPPGSELVIQLAISNEQAQALSTTLYSPLAQGSIDQGVTASSDAMAMPKPTMNMHETALGVMLALNSTLLCLELVGEVTAHLTGTLVLKAPQGITRVSCNPADGIALALRQDSRICCASNLLASAHELEDVLSTLSSPAYNFAQDTLARYSNKISAQYKKTATRLHTSRPDTSIARQKHANVSAQHLQQLLPANKQHIGAYFSHLSLCQESPTPRLLQALHKSPYSVPGFLLPSHKEHPLFFTEGKSAEACWNALLQLLIPETNQRM